MVHKHKNSKGEMYWLHSNGNLYWFSRKKGARVVDLPDGYKTVENRDTGLPYLVRQ